MHRPPLRHGLARQGVHLALQRLSFGMIVSARSHTPGNSVDSHSKLVRKSWMFLILNVGGSEATVCAFVSSSRVNRMRKSRSDLPT